MRNYERMGKADLRAACKATGISYGKMSVAEMRAALAARTPAATAPAPVAAPVMPHPAAGSVLKPTPGKRTNVVQRVKQNGIKRPGPGKCLAVWEAMEALHAKTGNVPAAKDATDWATANGANASNATQELSRWRKFAGLTKPAKVAKEARQAA